MKLRHTTIAGLITLFSASYSFGMEQNSLQEQKTQTEEPSEETEEEIEARREKEKAIQEQRAQIQASVKKQLSNERVFMIRQFDPRLNPPAE